MKRDFASSTKTIGGTHWSGRQRSVGDAPPGRLRTSSAVSDQDIPRTHHRAQSAVTLRTAGVQHRRCEGWARFAGRDERTRAAFIVWTSATRSRALPSHC